ncbi:hypothetical protein AN958_04104 [Leucoagaricus sp. SymC.cos]|nr:hypothetical protein AN958_04104 [Leucoagaricus sp. SymC.cos]
MNVEHTPGSQARQQNHPPAPILAPDPEPPFERQSEGQTQPPSPVKESHGPEGTPTASQNNKRARDEGEKDRTNPSTKYARLENKENEMPEGNKAPEKQGTEASTHAPQRENRYAALPSEMEEDPVEEMIDPVSRRKIIHNKITTTKGLTYTAPPKDDFPSPQITRPLTKGLARSIVDEIDRNEGHCIFMRPWKMHFSPDLQDARQKIRNVLTRFLGREKSVKIMQLSTEDGTSKEADGSPWYFIITGLTKTEHDLAVKTRVIATQQAMLFILPRQQPIPNFLMLLRGFGYDDDELEEAKRVIMAAIKDKLKATPTLTKKLAASINDPESVSRAIDKLINGIYVNMVAVPDSPQLDASVTTYFSVLSDYTPPLHRYQCLHCLHRHTQKPQLRCARLRYGNSPRRTRQSHLQPMQVQ